MTKSTILFWILTSTTAPPPRNWLEHGPYDTVTKKKSVHAIYEATEGINHLHCPTVDVQQWNRKQKNQLSSYQLDFKNLSGRGKI